MDVPVDTLSTRRAFLRFLLGSPLLMSLGFKSDALAAGLGALDGEAGTSALSMRQGTPPIRSPDQAFSVMDFEGAARAALPPAHFGYLASGVDDDATLRANHEDFARYQIRARRLIDVQRIDMSVDLLGTRWETPIVICPCGSQKAFHPEGEIATARAARSKGILQILSGVSTTSVEDVTTARDAPVWYQLYPTNDATVAMAIVRRAAAAGCPVLVITVDLNAGRNLETRLRAARLDDRDCSACHQPGMRGILRRKPMFDGLDLSKVTDLGDALMALRYGADAIIVSNHGGRAEESGRSTITCLPEVVAAVNQRIPVLLDGGIRRGTDIFKAIALGARAVGVGRPYLWGLAAFGQPGVETVLTLLQRELGLIMRQAGTRDLASISSAHVVQGAP